MLNSIASPFSSNRHKQTQKHPPQSNLVPILKLIKFQKNYFKIQMRVKLISVLNEKCFIYLISSAIILGLQILEKNSLSKFSVNYDWSLCQAKNYLEILKVTLKWLFILLIRNSYETKSSSSDEYFESNSYAPSGMQRCVQQTIKINFYFTQNIINVSLVNKTKKKTYIKARTNVRFPIKTL